MSGISWIRARGAVLVFIAAAFWPLQILAVNVVGIVRPERVFLLVGLIWLVGMAVIGLIKLAGLDLEVAENIAFVTLVFAMNGGPILRRFDEVAVLILVGIPVFAWWLMYRLKGSAVVNALIWGTAVALAVGPIVTFIQTERSGDGPSIMEHPPAPMIALATRPDIFLVVFDGYPGLIAAEQDDIDVGVVDVVSGLRERGFQVPESSWSAYWVTMLSIPSLLDMSYPVVEDGWRGLETRAELQDVLASGGNLVETLRSNGYRTHMVESGWSGVSCEDGYDRCVPSPLLDEATDLILRHTALAPVMDESPGPYVLGALAAFDWLIETAPALSSTPEPDFVFAHVVSPHAPFMLEPDCTIAYDYKRTGAGFNHPAATVAERIEFLEGQIDCLDRLMLDLSDAIAPDDIVIFVSDHGTDSRYQANKDTVDWDDEATIERLNNFLAVRAPAGCVIGEEVLVPNVMLRVLGCLGSDPVPLVDRRMWINPMSELDLSVVQALLDMRPGSG